MLEVLHCFGKINIFGNNASMKYKKIKFTLDYNELIYSNLKTACKLEIKYKRIRNEMLRKKPSFIVLYKDKPLNESFTFERKALTLTTFINERKYSYYKTKTLNFDMSKKNFDHRKYIEERLNIGNFKCLLDRKIIDIKIDYNEQIYCKFHLQKTSNIEYDIFKSAKEQKQCIRRSIKINMFYCGDFTHEIFNLQRYHDVTEYDKEDGIFFILDDKFVFTKNKNRRVNEIHLKRIVKELQLNFIEDFHK